MYISGPQHFWHHGPVSWKTVFHGNRAGGGGDGFGVIQAHYIQAHILLCARFLAHLNQEQSGPEVGDP